MRCMCERWAVTLPTCSRWRFAACKAGSSVPRCCFDSRLQIWRCAALHLPKACAIGGSLAWRQADCHRPSASVWARVRSRRHDHRPHFDRCAIACALCIAIAPGAIAQAWPEQKQRCGLHKRRRSARMVSIRALAYGVLSHRHLYGFVRKAYWRFTETSLLLRSGGPYAKTPRNMFGTMIRLFWISACTCTSPMLTDYTFWLIRIIPQR